MVSVLSDSGMFKKINWGNNNENIFKERRSFNMDSSKNYSRRTKGTGRQLFKSSKPKIHLANFCESTSIHGLRYLSDGQRPYYEKFLWLAGIIFCLLTCVHLIKESWQRWKSSPVILASDERLKSVWDLPFPAITICPIARIDLRRFNMTKKGEFWWNLNPWEKSIFFDLQLQCEYPYVYDYNGEHNTDAVNSRIEQFAISKTETIHQMYFANTNATPAVTTLMTETGLCYTFNMLPTDHIFRPNTYHAVKRYLDLPIRTKVVWSMDKGYEAHTIRLDDSYPFRAFGAGKSTGIHIQLRVHSDELEDRCSNTLRGFRVVLHSPAHLPRVNQHSFFVPLGRATNVVVTPKEITTNEQLRRTYSPEQRQCYFPQERYLRFFNEYTQHNCEIECMANITLDFCKCVAFYMPRELNTKVCSLHNYTCVQSVVRLFEASSSEFLEGLEKESSEVAEVLRKLKRCECPQSCFALSYITDRSHMRAEPQKAQESVNRARGGNVSSYEKFLEQYEWSLLWIYYEETKYIPIRRVELYGTTTFIANCGGVLGLCLGMSILSIVEIFYWFVIRPIWRMWKCVSTMNKVTLTLDIEKHEPRTVIYFKN